MCSVMSDADGQYHCEHLPAGDYLVTVMPPPLKGPCIVRVGSLVYGRTFYPSTTDPDAATLVTLTIGEASTADIVVRARAAASIRGKLSGDFPKSSIRVFLHSQNLDLPASASVDYDSAHGEVVIASLPEGSYRVEADGTVGGVMQHMTAEAYVRSGTSQNVNFEQTVYHTVTGQLKVGANCDRCTPGSLQIRRIDRESNWQVDVPVSSDGSFLVRQVVNGDYVFMVSPPRTTCVSEIELAGKPLRNQILHLNNDYTDLTVRVQLERTKAVASGTLDATRIVPGKTGVVLQSVTTGGLDIRRVDAHGQFDYDGLAPGEYRLYAWRNLDQVEYRNREFLAKFRKEANTFSISDADTRVTDLDPRVNE